MKLSLVSSYHFFEPLFTWQQRSLNAPGIVDGVKNFFLFMLNNCFLNFNLLFLFFNHRFLAPCKFVAVVHHPCKNNNQKQPSEQPVLLISFGLQLRLLSV